MSFTFGQDTFSICNIDTVTGEAGSAGASCIDDGFSFFSVLERVELVDDPADELYLDLNVPSAPFRVDPIDVLQ